MPSVRSYDWAENSNVTKRFLNFFLKVFDIFCK